MRILLVEDDHNQAALIRDGLQREFPEAAIERVSTESDFMANVGRYAAEPPDLVIMDIMLRWADPAPEMPPAPEEVVREGFYRAGFRCQRMLLASERTASTPVVLYTVLDAPDLGPDLKAVADIGHVVHLRKQSRLDPLFMKIRELAPRL